MPSDLLVSPGPQDSPEPQASPGPPLPRRPALPSPLELPPPLELPGLRLIKVPDAAPPYDCETHGAACPAMSDTAEAGPYDTGPSPELAALRTEPASVSGSPADQTPPPASPASAGTAIAWMRQFAQAIVEILAGSRSPRQIVRLTTDHARTQIESLTPLFAAGQRPRIRRIVTSWPTARIVEMAVVVSSGPRSHALAMRFEHTPARPATPGRPARPARWLCTELEAG